MDCKMITKIYFEISSQPGTLFEIELENPEDQTNFKEAIEAIFRGLYPVEAEADKILQAVNDEI